MWLIYGQEECIFLHCGNIVLPLFGLHQLLQVESIVESIPTNTVVKNEGKTADDGNNASLASLATWTRIQYMRQAASPFASCGTLFPFLSMRVDEVDLRKKHVEVMTMERKLRSAMLRLSELI